MHAHTSVNADNAQVVGESIMEKLVGVKVSDYSFKRKEQVITLASKAAVTVDGEPI